MLTLAGVRGHAVTADRLRLALAGDRVGSAYLLSGPNGIGKRTLALAFAARVLCAAPRDDDACGECAQCTRVAAGTHPDLRIVERDPERRDIGVEAARGLARWLSLRAMNGDRKVAVIDGAETLSVPAQNALLKTIEEPPGRALLLLTATTPTLLLPTVRSRCQHLRLDPLEADDLDAILAAAGVAPERIPVLAARAEGSAGRALELANEAEDGARALVLETLPRLADQSAAELSALAQKIGGAADDALAVMVSWYRDGLGLALGTDAVPRRNPDAAMPLQALAARLPAPALLRVLEILCATIRDLGRNANKQLALETMLFAMRDVLRDNASAAGVARG